MGAVWGGGAGSCRGWGSPAPLRNCHAGGPSKEPGPVSPSETSLFPTGFDINEVINVRVRAPVPSSRPLYIPSPLHVVPLPGTFSSRRGLKGREIQEGVPFFNFGFHF